jgi:hypothetical protein
MELNVRLFCVCVIGLLCGKSNDGARLLFGKCAAHPVATSGLRPLNAANVNYMCTPGVLQPTISLNCVKGGGSFERNEMFIFLYNFCCVCNVQC